MVDTTTPGARGRATPATKTRAVTRSAVTESNVPILPSSGWEAVYRRICRIPSGICGRAPLPAAAAPWYRRVPGRRVVSSFFGGRGSRPGRGGFGIVPGAMSAGRARTARAGCFYFEREGGDPFRWNGALQSAVICPTAHCRGSLFPLESRPLRHRFLIWNSGSSADYSVFCAHPRRLSRSPCTAGRRTLFPGEMICQNCPLWARRRQAHFTGIAAPTTAWPLFCRLERIPVGGGGGRRHRRRPADRVLDVATGTGMVAKALRHPYAGEVVGIDQSADMLRLARTCNDSTNRWSRAEPRAYLSRTRSFHHLTFTYLLLYVDGPVATMRELARVGKPGGRVAMVEFGLLRGGRPFRWLYTRIGPPALGRVVSARWSSVGAFLGPSIESFYRLNPPETLAGIGAMRAGDVDYH